MGKQITNNMKESENMDTKYRVKVLNIHNKLTMSRLLDRESATQFAEQIWNANSLTPLKWVCVEDQDGMIYTEYEN